jgi:hypothetical protein
MAVDEKYVAQLVAQLDADKALAESQTIVTMDDFETCDDDLCLWCN